MRAKRVHRSGAPMSEKADRLSDALRAQLELSHTSITHAAGEADIPYDRLKKALQANRFSRADLDSLRRVLPDDFNFEKYSYHPARTYVMGGAGSESEPDEFFVGIKDMYTSFAQLKRVAKGAELGPIVSDLYRNWVPQMSMVLFMHPDYTPLEWSPANRADKSNIYQLLKAGGRIVYVAGLSEATRGGAPDAVEKKFMSFCSRLAEEAADGDPDPTGFVALLRVPHCIYCIPFQKPSLFTFAEDGVVQIRAFTTIEVPETTDGESTAGTIVVPQTKAAAEARVSYIDELTFELLNGQEPCAFQARSFPDLEAKEIVRRIRGVI